MKRPLTSNYKDVGEDRKHHAEQVQSRRGKDEGYQQKDSALEQEHLHLHHHRQGDNDHQPPRTRVKLEKADEASSNSNNQGMSPPPQTESVPILHCVDPESLSLRVFQHSSSCSTSPPRILPPNEPRKSGTCYFCKKAFMKNKQLMNHVCPKKPKLGPTTSGKLSK